jgi:hypothetical protein
MVINTFQDYDRHVRATFKKYMDIDEDTPLISILYKKIIIMVKPWKSNDVTIIIEDQNMMNTLFNIINKSVK